MTVCTNSINFFDNLLPFLCNFPFLIIWLSTVVALFFIELYILIPHTFNIKHTYLNSLTRTNIFLIFYTVLYKKATLHSFLRFVFLKNA